MLVVARLAPDASKLASSNQTEAPRRVTEGENKECGERNRRFVGDVTPQVEFRRPRRISGVALNFWFWIPSTGTLKGSSLSALKEKTSARRIKPVKLGSFSKKQFSFTCYGTCMGIKVGFFVS